MRTISKKHIIWWCVLALTTLFIWGQSLLGREASAAQSGGLQSLLGRLFGEGVYTTFFYQNIRKVAHFAEYAVLGAEWAGYCLSNRGAHRPVWWLMLVAGPITATCDELLQFISARAPRVTDVLLDCGGYFCGMGVTLGLIFLWRQRRKYSAVK